MEGESDIYSQLNKFEQSLDSELNELELLLQNSSTNENDGAPTSTNTRNDSDFVVSTNDIFCNETCIVKTTTTRECQGEMAYREVFYRCGNQCYQGEVALDLQYVFDTSLDDISVILAKLQQQKNEFLSYLCDSDDIPESNSFRRPLYELERAEGFVASELASTVIAHDIKRLSWDDNDIYYELVGDTSGLFPDVLFACSKVYSDNGLVVVLYFEGVFYLYTKTGYLDRCSLFDVDFSVYFTGTQEGSTLAMYSDDSSWMKLSVWKAVRRKGEKTPPLPISDSDCNFPEPIQRGLESGSYVQSYIILKADKGKEEREVMFRFGAWCYSGRVELQTIVSLHRIPEVIREVRLAQQNLDFVGDVSTLSEANKFVKPIQLMTQISKYMEEEAASCEVHLRQILTPKEDDDCCFFEFGCDNESNSLEAVELICNKVYNGNGVIGISIYHNKIWYLVLEDGSNENPLLDSKFPDLSTKRRGFQLKTYEKGYKSWPELMSLSLWQRASSTSVCGDIISVDGVFLSSNKQRKQSYLRSLLLRRKNR